MALLSLLFASLGCILLYIVVKMAGWRDGRAMRLASAVRLAAARGRTSELEALSHEDGFDPESAVTGVSGGFSALLAACAAGQLEAVKWLLARGASTRAQKADGWKMSSLHLAASATHGGEAIGRLLLAHDPELSSLVDYAGRTAADIAEELGGARAPWLTDDDGEGSHHGITSSPATSLYAQAGNRKLFTRSRLKRDFQGLGTTGTSLPRGHLLWRLVACVWLMAGLWYMTWRAGWTIYARPSGECDSTSFPNVCVLEGNRHFYLGMSCAFYVCELIIFLHGLTLLLECWNVIDRAPRLVLEDTQPRDPDCGATVIAFNELPTVDVFVPTYSEDVASTHSC